MKQFFTLTLVLLILASCHNQKSITKETINQNNPQPAQPNSESVTYYLWPINWSTGKLRGQIDHIIFTKVRANLTGGGYKCYWTLSFTAETFGWYRFKNNDFRLILKNSQGGTLATFPLTINLSCSLTGRPEVMSRQADFDPDIYDIITNQTKLTGDQISTWVQCK